MILGEGKGHIQSVIVAGILFLLAFVLFMFGLLADVVASNRKLQEETLYRLKKESLK